MRNIVINTFKYLDKPEKRIYDSYNERVLARHYSAYIIISGKLPVKTDLYFNDEIITKHMIYHTHCKSVMPVAIIYKLKGDKVYDYWNSKGNKEMDSDKYLEAGECRSLLKSDLIRH